MLTWFRSCLRRRGGAMFGALVLALLTVLAGAGLLLVAGWFLTAAFLTAVSVSFNVFVPSALVRGLSFLRIVARYGERLLGHQVTLTILVDLRSLVFAHMAQWQPAQLARYRDGDLVARLVGDIDALDSMVLILWTPLLVTLAVGMLFVGLVQWWSLGLAVALGLVLIVSLGLLPWRAARCARNAGKQSRDMAAHIRVLAHETAAAHVDVVAFAAEEAVMQRFRQTNARLEAAQTSVGRTSAWAHACQQLLANLAWILVLLWLWPLVLENRLTPAVWVGLLFAAMVLFEAAGPWVRGAAYIGSYRAALQRVDSLRREQPPAPHPQPLPLPRSAPLSADEVSFSWDGHNKVLKEVSLVVQPGEVVAITGPSGSGKSTLLSLMMGVVGPTSGSIRYGDVPLACTDADERYTRFSLLSQDSPIFTGSIRRNLLMADPLASEAQLWQALEDARLAEFVHHLPNGLDSYLGESGRRLSVGQHRRLALARTLLTPAAVLLLDEPTAGLDRATQHDFFVDLKRVLAGRAAVIATHQALPEGLADQCWALRDGRLLAPWTQAHANEHTGRLHLIVL